MLFLILLLSIDSLRSQLMIRNNNDFEFEIILFKALL